MTDIIKITAGRPRPDFFWRCFPDGKINNNSQIIQCTNTNIKDIYQGYKSFPSGHASFAFLSLGFISFYFVGKLKIFTPYGRGSAVRIIICLTPLICALLIGISRTCDYHHFPSDIAVGSLIGISIAYLCYRQYYPKFDDSSCYKPHALNNSMHYLTDDSNVKSEKEGCESETTCLLDNKEI